MMKLDNPIKRIHSVISNLAGIFSYITQPATVTAEWEKLASPKLMDGSKQYTQTRRIQLYIQR